MWSLKERVQRLEDDLRASPMRHYAYDDLPFAIFCYQPDQEWAMRREIELLRTRLRQSTARTIETVSLADLMWQSIEESEGLDAIRELEHRSGFTAAENQVFRYLSDRDWRPLPGLLLERLKPMQQDKHLVLITRAATLAPNIYRVSKLLDEMKGHTRVPCVLFFPATTEGRTSLRYMGIAENEGRGSYHTKVYADELD